MSNQSPDPRPSRRGFLDWLLGICGAITAAAAAVPAMIYVWPVTRKGPAGGRQLVPAAAELAPWQAHTETVSGKPVILLRTRDGFLAYSAACTHLGCIVHWDADQKAFLCPCHAAKFDVDGKVVDGPPPAPLRPYTVTEVDGNVYLQDS